MIIIRIEDRKIYGQGHRSRAIALAQACKRLSHPYLILAGEKNWYDELNEQGFSAGLLEGDGGDINEAHLLVAELKKQDVDFIIIDGQRFDPSLVKIVQDNGFKVALIDDTGLNPQPCAWCVINPNIYADSKLYSKGWPAKCYAGPEFVLLREPFILQPETAIDEKLITLALGISGSKELINLLTEQISALGYHIKIAQKLGPTEMVSLIDNSALVICGASVTLHEVWARNRIALPVYQAKDQFLFVQYLIENGMPYAESLGKDPVEAAASILGTFKKGLIPGNTEGHTISKQGANILVEELIKNS